MKKTQRILLFIIVVILVFFVRACYFQKREDIPIKNDKHGNIGGSRNILNSSEVYFIGEWKVKYSDMVHYVYDEKGVPLIDLQKQLNNYSFSHIGETLILEEEYPVVESEYHGKSFVMKIDLKISHLFIEGELTDENNWRALLEYYGLDGQIISKCYVNATRIR